MRDLLFLLLFEFLVEFSLAFLQAETEGSDFGAYFLQGAFDILPFLFEFIQFLPDLFASFRIDVFLPGFFPHRSQELCLHPFFSPEFGHQAHLDEFDLGPEEEGVQTLPQILVPEENKHHQQQNNTQEEPEYPEGETLPTLRRGLRGEYFG